MQSYQYEEANEVFPLSIHDPDETMDSFHNNMEKARLKQNDPMLEKTIVKRVTIIIAVIMEIPRLVNPLIEGLNSIPH